MCNPIMKDGVCIAGDLNKCSGCAEHFFKELSKAGFSGLKITEEGISKF